MTKWNQNSYPAAETIDAVQRLCDCLTDRDKKVLTVERNGQTATVEAQLIARWWNYLPQPCCPFVFKARVLQILDTQGRLLDLLEKIKDDDIFAALLNPDNYKEKNTKLTRAKSIDRKMIDSDSTTVNLVKSYSRGVGGTTAINKAYDYGNEWDIADRKRLDKILIEKSDDKLLDTETGAEDDTPIPEEEDWIDKKERLDTVQARRLNAKKPVVKFGEVADDGTKNNEVLIFDASVSQSTGATAGDSELSSNTYLEGLRRQNFSITRERIILADALNEIQNLEFIDIREKFYKYFDPLFYLPKKRSCR